MTDTPEHKAPSLLDRIAQRRMQQEGYSSAGDEAPATAQADPARRSAAFKQVMGASDRVGYAAKLKRDLMHRPQSMGGASMSGYSADNDTPYKDYSLLQELLAEKIHKQTGLRPQLTPQEIVHRLKKDDYIVAVPTTMAGERLKTTPRAISMGIFSIIKGLSMKRHMENNGAYFVFDEADFLQALKKQPNSFLSRYQNSPSLNTTEVMKRLVDKGMISPLQTEKVDGQDRLFHYAKTQAMIDRLKELAVPVDLIKGVGAKVSREGIATPLKKDERAFDALFAEPVKLTPADIVMALTQRKLLYFAKHNDTSIEMRVASQEAVDVLGLIGINVDNRPGGGFNVQVASVKKALEDEPDAYTDIVRAMKTHDRTGFKSR